MQCVIQNTGKIAVKNQYRKFFHIECNIECFFQNFLKVKERNENTENEEGDKSILLLTIVSIHSNRNLACLLISINSFSKVAVRSHEIAFFAKA